jgi:malate synthase
MSTLHDILTNPTVLALLGTIFGGVGLKVTEAFLGKKKVQSDEAASIRKELREDVNSLRQQIKEQKMETDKWRDEYYKSLEVISATKSEVINIKTKIGDLEDEVGVWRDRYYQLWEDMAVERDAPGLDIPMPLKDSVQAVDAGMVR